MEKTGNFEEDVRAGYYRYERDKIYTEKKQGPLFQVTKPTFSEDFVKFLAESGVPQKYINKVASYAIEHGHSSGEGEILAVAYGLIEIFQ